MFFDDPVRAAAPRARAPGQPRVRLHERHPVLPEPRARPTPSRAHRLPRAANGRLRRSTRVCSGNADLPATYGDGRLNDILSVDISDFFTPGSSTGRPPSTARPRRSPTMLGAAEDRPQLLPRHRDQRRHADQLVPRPGGRLLEAGQAGTSTEPLLINTAGCWSSRPEAADQGREPVPRLGLRALQHRPRDDGRRRMRPVARRQTRSSTAPAQMPRKPRSANCGRRRPGTPPRRSTSSSTRPGSRTSWTSSRPRSPSEGDGANGAVDDHVFLGHEDAGAREVDEVGLVLAADAPGPPGSR